MSHVHAYAHDLTCWCSKTSITHLSHKEIRKVRHYCYGNYATNQLTGKQSKISIPAIACSGKCMRQVVNKHEFAHKEWLNKIDPLCKTCFKKQKEAGYHACGTLKTCSSCGRNNSHKYFSTIEWDREDTVRLCRDCLPRECHQCRQTKRREHFRKHQWTRKDGMRTCKVCERRRCMTCFQEKGKQAFSEENWELPDNASNAICKQCWRQRTVPGLWTCFASGCKKQLPKEDFTLAHQRYDKKTNG